MPTPSPAICIALALVALSMAGCDRRADPAPAPNQAAPAAATPAVGPAAVAPALDPLARPPGADDLDLALSGAQQFNARAAAELATIGRSEARIKALVAKVAATVTGGNSGPESQRRQASAAIQAARSETEALHDGLTTGAAAFRLAAASGMQSLDAAVASCNADVALAAWPACPTLLTEQTTLTASVAALARRYDAAEAVWRREKTRLEEASAIVALGSDGAGLR